jgi:hypothetical protein
MIHDVLACNVFAAGRAVIECGLESGMAYQRTVECLARKCECHPRAIRQLAIGLLRQIGGDFADQKFLELLNSQHLTEAGEFEHIRKMALVEIARRRRPYARETVYAHLDWRSYTNMEWMFEEHHAGAAVMEALGWFDDEESQRHIADRWISSVDMPTREACSAALLRIANRGNLCSSAKGILLDWITSNQTHAGQTSAIIPAESNGRGDIDYWGVEPILAAAHDKSLAPQLIAALLAASEQDLQSNCIERILRSFHEREVVDLFIQQAKDCQHDLVKCARFLDILSEIDEVPLDFFLEFAQSELPSDAKAYAIRGLGKSPFEEIEDILLTAIRPPSYERLLEVTNAYQIELALWTHRDADVIQAIRGLSNLPDLSEDAREYLRYLTATANSGSELLKLLAHSDASEDVRWSIVKSCQHLQSGTLQKTIQHLLDPQPYEYLLISTPCNYARVQDEVFRVLARHGRLALLALKENQPIFLYNISSETLFDLIRRDSTYEMQEFIQSFIKTHTNARHSTHVERMVINAAWVLVALGYTEKAQQVIDQVLGHVGASKPESDWILSDVLKGISLLPPDYALAQIEKIWANASASDSGLVRTHCIEALELIGSRQALDMLARIAQETLGQPEQSLEPERALRAMLRISPVGRQEWLIGLLQQDLHDRHAALRVIEMLGLAGDSKAIPALQPFLENSPSERIGSVAFEAIRNIHARVMNEVWYNDEEKGCL